MLAKTGNVVVCAMLVAGLGVTEGIKKPVRLNVSITSLNLG
jgi:hypothetical protein